MFLRVAEGAHVVKNEYERLVAETPDQTWITSSCASVNYYIKRHRPEAAKYLLPVLTPMKALPKSCASAIRSKIWFHRAMPVQKRQSL